jgi:predicted phosphoribosyltransferase
MRGAWPMPDLADRTVLLVDDAIVSGLTMRAAADAAERHETRKVVVVAPLCSIEAAQALVADGYAVVSLETVPAGVAARVHGDARREPCPPIADAEVHELVSRELHDVGYDPFGGLAIDGI